MTNNCIITTENESLQTIGANKKEHVEELYSILESQLTGKNKILHDSK